MWNFLSIKKIYIFGFTNNKNFYRFKSFVNIWNVTKNRIFIFSLLSILSMSFFLVIILLSSNDIEWKFFFRFKISKKNYDLSVEFYPSVANRSLINRREVCFFELRFVIKSIFYLVDEVKFFVEFFLFTIVFYMF